MTGKKLNLTYIVSDAKRKVTLKKRKNSLIKKMGEITTLCGIEACAIISSHNELQPEVWPSHFGVQNVLSKFKRMSETERYMKMLNQESFMNQRIMKAQEQLKKLRNENKKKETTLLMYQCLRNGNVDENIKMANMNDLSWMIDQTLKDIDKKITKGQPEEAMNGKKG
ncbi:hypothetical protein TanjilG_11432 [Lupinus angustifolius]|uniref:MADS-box domain-containing protein n=1 Tax=Lupinus angustifolius TaxID=3871 RepID=A0A1J7HMJ9_LUPAN|nr:PREDICTED: agamous-like MADS-box protein AGL80 [Lupinus angustifolius]OIW14087.1 hypothetical protein TanjilG_11432 [Lupinus angustifolius]